MNPKSNNKISNSMYSKNPIIEIEIEDDNPRQFDQA